MRKIKEIILAATAGIIGIGLFGSMVYAFTLGPGYLQIEKNNRKWAVTKRIEDRDHIEQSQLRLVGQTTDGRSLYFKEMFPERNWVEKFTIKDRRGGSIEYDIGREYGAIAFTFKDMSKDLAKVVLEGSGNYYLFDVEKEEVRGLVKNNFNHCSFSKAESISASAAYKGMSDNGEKIVFDAWISSLWDGELNREVYMFDVEKDKLKNISDNSAKDEGSVISRDGKVILFLSDRNKRVELFVYNTQSGIIKVLGDISTTSIHDVKDLKISPDNQEITWKIKDSVWQHKVDNKLEDLVK
ncbi:hypothetical protein J4208_01820 [Candidatus Woesearchaeota archaeon]|nr:hypothetical protein [Candidatus Woesearchaeota archaeon]